MIAKPYHYSDGPAWNPDRFEIFVREGSDLISVGGAMRTWGGRTIAYLCRVPVNRRIRTPGDAESACSGRYVWADTVKAALTMLKVQYPDPASLLDAAHAEEMAAF